MISIFSFWILDIRETGGYWDTGTRDTVGQWGEGGIEDLNLIFKIAFYIDLERMFIPLSLKNWKFRPIILENMEIKKKG